MLMMFNNTLQNMCFYLCCVFTCDSGLYCCETVSISAITLSVSSTLRPMSAASSLRVSKVVITESSSNIFPLASLRACRRDFSNCLKRRWNSPEILNLILFNFSHTSTYLLGYLHYLTLWVLSIFPVAVPRDTKSVIVNL